MSGLFRQGAFLAVSRYLEQAVMVLTPMVLVRTVDAQAFGEYRLFWLLANTVALIAPLGMPRSLLYFFPRTESARDKSMLVGQTTVFLLTSAFLAILLIFLTRDWMPEGTRNLLHNNGLLIAVFLVSWIVGSLIDFLPSATQEFGWQARATIITSVFRGALLVGAAVIYRRLDAILIATLIAALIRLGFLAYFIRTRSGIQLFPLNKSKFAAQLAYGVPFGLSSLFFNLRKQMEQWIVAGLFTAAQFGVFSVAITLLMPFDVLRGVLANLLLPRMSQAHARQGHDELIAINSRANLTVNAIIFPGIASLFAFADQIIELLFTQKYLASAPVLKVYLVQVVLGFEVETLIAVFALRSFSVSFSMLMLPLSLVASYLGALWWGMVGAAAGSLLATTIGAIVQMGKLARVMGRPVRHLQDWKSQGALLLLAVACATTAYFSVGLIGLGIGPRAILGPALTFAIYGALLVASGYYRRLGWKVGS